MRLLVFIFAILPLLFDNVHPLDEEHLRDYASEIEKKLSNTENELSNQYFHQEVFNSSDSDEIESSELYVEVIHKVILDDFGSIDLSKIQDEKLKRKIKKLPKENLAALSYDEHNEVKEKLTFMNSIYQKVQLCSFEDMSNCSLLLIPDVQDSLNKNENPEEIRYYWLEWRRQTEGQVLKQFQDFVKLYRKAAKLNNFKKPSNMLLEDFEDENILSELENVIKSMRPIYEQFHAHIRYQLRKKYGEDFIKKYSPYPLDVAEVLLGKSFGEEKNISFPFPEQNLYNITEILQKNHVQTVDTFRISEDFFSSIGFEKLGEEFWTQNAYPYKAPEDYCYNKAWSIENRDFLSYCPEVSADNVEDMFTSIFKVQSNRLMRPLDSTFQKEPLPNFSDGLALSLGLSASHNFPYYVRKSSNGKYETIDFERQFNQIYLKALQETFILPILFVLDKYRAAILDKDVLDWDNCAYWKTNVELTGGAPPVPRSKSDFDVPAKLLLGVDNSYSTHIVQYVIKYQIFKHFCEQNGQYQPNDKNSPLHNCDLSGDLKVGEKFKQAISQGSFITWQDALEILTGNRYLDASGFLAYFEPIKEWLENENAKNDAEVGWNNDSNCH